MNTDLSYIAEPLRGLAVPIGGLELDPRNARKHPPRSIETIKASLTGFGQQKPIVLKLDGKTVLAGNGTLVAAQELGWTHIAAVRSGLDGQEATAFGLADNKTAETSEWDFEAVADLLKDLQAEQFDLTTTGWADFEIEPLLAAEWTPAAKEALPDRTEKPEPVNHDKKPTITIAGDEGAIVERAIKAVRASLGDDTTELQALALICGEWLAR